MLVLCFKNQSKLSSYKVNIVKALAYQIPVKFWGYCTIRSNKAAQRKKEKLHSHRSSDGYP